MLWFWIGCAILGYLLVGNSVAIKVSRSSYFIGDGEIGFIVLLWPFIVIIWLIVWPVQWWRKKNSFTR